MGVSSNKWLASMAFNTEQEFGFLPWASLAPDDSVLLLREASSEQIYALSLERP